MREVPPASGFTNPHPCSEERKRLLPACRCHKFREDVEKLYKAYQESKQKAVHVAKLLAYIWEQTR